jgi:hypothetical protein
VKPGISLAPLGWAKMVRSKVATTAWADFGILVNGFLRSWVRHRCQPAPGSTEAMASTRPGWASKTTRAVPDSPRATKERRNASQAALS